MNILFWGSIIGIFFAYCGYPISLFILSRFKKKPWKKTLIFPNVTLIITVYNEEKRINEKLRNTIDIDYPPGKLQILLASDGSIDRTNKIVKGYEKDGIELLAFKTRKGKEAAQKEAVRIASGDIIVFTDVATKLDSNGIKEIVSNFADPSVGCVSSEDRLIDLSGKPVGESLYVRYEMWLRRLESKVNSLVGLSGSFFAARKEVCKDFSPEMPSDFRTVLNSVRMRLRGVSDSKTIGYYLNVADEKQEFDRKIRTVLRGLSVFFNHLEFLNAFRYGLFSYQLFCHKLLRWMVPFFLLVAFLSDFYLAFTASFYYIVLIFQAAFYGIAIWGNLQKQFPKNIVIKIPVYFLTVNIAILVAWWRYLKGQRMVLWNPSER